MKKNILVVLILILSFLGISLMLVKRSRKPPLETKFVQDVSKENNDQKSEVEEDIFIKKPSSYHLLSIPKHVYQTFNNCGPATLSMILSYFGKDISQKELGRLMRPYQNPKGDNDDKTIFTYEFVNWAKRSGLEAEGRVNGDIELLKTFIANEIPVVVKTWLNTKEDIGHFRIVKGFDEQRKVIIQDDSFYGLDKKISYYDFLTIWQPFNYAYIVIYTKDQEGIVKKIMQDEWNEKKAWENALERARKESLLDPENIYPKFNMVSSYYHLQEFLYSARIYEEIEDKLPRRMLWYQIEPILAYQALKDFDRVFEITDKILNNGNRAFSELYQIRGEIYLEERKKDLAKKEFELALKYNENYEPAKEKLLSIQD